MADISIRDKQCLPHVLGPDQKPVYDASGNKQPNTVDDNLADWTGAFYQARVLAGNGGTVRIPAGSYRVRPGLIDLWSNAICTRDAQGQPLYGPPSPAAQESGALHALIARQVAGRVSWRGEVSSRSQSISNILPYPPGTAAIAASYGLADRPSDKTSALVYLASSSATSELRDLCIDGEGRIHTALRAEATAGLRLANLVVQNTLDYAAKLYDAEGGVVEDLVAVQNKGGGGGVLAVGCNGMTLNRVGAFLCVGTGLYVAGGGHVAAHEVTGPNKAVQYFDWLGIPRHPAGAGFLHLDGAQIEACGTPAEPAVCFDAVEGGVYRGMYIESSSVRTPDGKHFRSGYEGLRITGGTNCASFVGVRLSPTEFESGGAADPDGPDVYPALNLEWGNGNSFIGCCGVHVWRGKTAYGARVVVNGTLCTANVFQGCKRLDSYNAGVFIQPALAVAGHVGTLDSHSRLQWLDQPYSKAGAKAKVLWEAIERDGRLQAEAPPPAGVWERGQVIENLMRRESVTTPRLTSARMGWVCVKSGLDQGAKWAELPEVSFCDGLP